MLFLVLIVFSISDALFKANEFASSTVSAYAFTLADHSPLAFIEISTLL